ncbi:YqaE/Pmp3 family membrane protein [Halomonas litopenaei]|uniref:YqaE/Pmp3 family membrane protein n=1 Tax=Halomonas litopenaei TaxID=2109328 RepID=UPI003FA12085
MDAREYLARKGLDGERDKERPNTLEEKAWDRARESHDHRPRAGTPHDWEDWERYHDVLADGAESLEQKIDTEAHRQAQEQAQRDAQPQRTQPGAMDSSADSAAHTPADSPAHSPENSPANRSENTPANSPAVEHFTPPPVPESQEGADAQASRSDAEPETSAPKVASALMASPAARLALMVLVLLMPPLAVAVAEGGSRRVAIAFLLTLLGWLPGVAYGAWWLKQVNH